MPCQQCGPPRPATATLRSNMFDGNEWATHVTDGVDAPVGNSAQRFAPAAAFTAHAPCLPIACLAVNEPNILHPPRK